MFNRKVLLVVVCSCLIIMINMGMRQGTGLFLQPMSSDLGTGRETFSFAVALQNLISGLPFVAIIADRYGSRRVAIVGALLYAGGLLLISTVASSMGLYLSLGLLVGVALSCTSFVVIVGAVAQIVPVEKQARVFGILTAAGSFGMFVVVPGIQYLLLQFGWRTSAMLLAGFVCLMGLLALVGLPKRDTSSAEARSEAKARDELEGTFAETLLRARKHSGYLLLNAGFFVCGFHVAFIATHLPAFLTDNAVSPAASATALSLIGLFNIFGSSLFGYLGDLYRKKFLLSLLYFSRAIVIGLLLLFPITNTSAIIFGGAIGFLWLATVPLTSGTVAQIFGSRYLSTLYGIVFFCHQMGSFLGVWLGGRVYDSTGSYTPVWIAAIALSLLATLLHLPISDQRVEIRKTKAVPVAN